MSSVIVFTPIIIGAFPAVATAVAGVAASMGFSVLIPEHVPPSSRVGPESVTSVVANSEVIEEDLSHGQSIRIERDGVIIEFARNSRGECTVCATGPRTKGELKVLAEEASGRLVQQFAYHKLVTELKQRGYRVGSESVDTAGSIQMSVHLG